MKAMKKNYGLKKINKKWNKILDKDKFIPLNEL